MAGQKFFAHGTTVAIESDEVGGLVSISLSGSARGEVETTDTESGFVREWVGGMSDSGVMELEGRFIVDDSGQEALQANREAYEPVTFTITLSESATDDSEVAEITFDGFVQTFDIDLPLVDENAATFTSTVRISGGYTLTVT